MTPEQKVADAVRVVALRLEHALETGHRSTEIDANDLLETLLSVADQLDPQTPTETGPSLLEAAQALLEARENQMVTAVEWEQLERAVASAR